MHTATGIIIGDLPSGHLAVTLLDGEHAGATWAMLVEYCHDDQFVRPKVAR